MKALITTPVGFIAMGLLSINTWVLKPYYPGIISGKLSDFMGVAVLALTLDAMLSFINKAHLKPSHRYLLACTISGIYFTAIKVNAAANHWNGMIVDFFYGLVNIEANYVLIKDPQDLLALLILMPLIFYGNRYYKQNSTNLS